VDFFHAIFLQHCSLFVLAMIARHEPSKNLFLISLSLELKNGICEFVSKELYHFSFLGIQDFIEVEISGQHRVLKTPSPLATRFALPYHAYCGGIAGSHRELAISVVASEMFDLPKHVLPTGMATMVMA